jgi:hypothetical protein
MGAVSKGWSGPGFLIRVAIVSLTGVTWAVSSLHLVLAHPDYWDPVTAADFFAVYAYSAAWLLTGASLLILRETAHPARPLSAVILAVAAGSALAGVANGVEDALGVAGFGTLYVIGAVIGGFGLFAVAAMLWASPARELAFVPAIGGVATVLVTTGGGVLALAAWLGFGFVLIRERRSPGPVSTVA